MELREGGGDFFLENDERIGNASALLITEAMEGFGHEVIAYAEMRERALDALDDR